MSNRGVLTVKRRQGNTAILNVWGQVVARNQGGARRIAHRCLYSVKRGLFAARIFLYLSTMWQTVEDWARRIKRDTVALYLVARDSRTPWYAKALALVIAAYALSPIDLIPDFIPVLGYLDDLLILPLGILIVIRLVPDDLMAECRQKAESRSRPKSHWTAIAFVVAVWCLGAAMIGWWGYRAIR